MTLDFPNNPSNGQKYPDPSIEGQPQWVYNKSEKVWKIQNPLGPVGPSGPVGPVGPVGPSGPAGSGANSVAPTVIDFEFDKRHAAWRNKDSAFTVTTLEFDSGKRPQPLIPDKTRTYKVPPGCNRLGMLVSWATHVYNFDNEPGYPLSTGFKGRCYGYNSFNIGNAQFLTGWRDGGPFNVKQSFLAMYFRLGVHGSTTALRNGAEYGEWSRSKNESEWHVAEVTAGSTVSLYAATYLQQISELGVWIKQFRVTIFPYNSSDSQDPFTLPEVGERAITTDEEIFQQYLRPGLMNEEDDKDDEFTFVANLIKNAAEVVRINIDSGEYDDTTDSTQVTNKGRLTQALKDVYKTNTIFGSAPWQTHHDLAKEYLYGLSGIMTGIDDLIQYPMAGVTRSL